GFGPPAIRGVISILDGVDPAYETELAGEFGRHPGRDRAPREIAGVLTDGCLHGPATLADGLFILLRLVKPVADIPRAGEGQRRVDGHEPAVVVHELPIREEPADVRIAIEVVLDPAEDVLSPLSKGGIEDAVGLSRPFVVGEQQADRRSVADFSTELGPVSRIHDPARLDRARHADEIEDFLALEKEGAQLRVLQRKALIDVDLLCVRLDLRKV